MAAESFREGSTVAFIPAKLSLMTLPVELRELVWEAALAEDEPLIAYLERRVVARPTRTAHQPTMMRQVRRIPGSPPLLHVSKQTRIEAFPIYWKSNTFAFSICADLPDQVGLWQSFVAQRGTHHTYMSTFPPRPSIIETSWNVRLEFSMFRPDITAPEINADNFDWSYSPLPEDPERVATIDVRLVDAAKEGRVEFIFGGVLAEACTCWPRAYAAKWSLADPNHSRTIARFAQHVEKELQDVWSYSDSMRGYSQTRQCKECGKPTPKRVVLW
ncbi:hypothetical protein LTR17_014629 [Elasticomyces elasticus]|nr:hypothetical protein LTR17_014629 [Elasticomyces elasticus]